MRKASAYLLLAGWLCSALLCSRSLSHSLFFLYLKETHVVSGRPSMKFNSHPPNGVFIKAFTITASRRVWPAQLGSAQLCKYVLYKEGGRGQSTLGKESAGWRTRDRVCKENRECEQCERGSEGLGQSVAGRQRGLICQKGSSASCAI